MKKYILLLLMTFGVFVLSGCGGSDNISNSGHTAPPAVIEIKPNDMIIDKNSSTYVLNVSFIKKVDSSYKIELSSFDLSAEGCILNGQPDFTPSVLYLNEGIDSVDTLRLSGSIETDCIPSKYTFSATQKTTKNGHVDRRMFSVTYDSNGGSVPRPSTGFFNATTPLKITKSNISYEIKVQLLEDGYVSSGKIVKMKPFDSKYGSINNYDATTGTDGYAIFHYTSPDILPGDGTSAIVELTYDNNGKVMTQKIVLQFDSVVIPPVNTAHYTLTAAPDNVTITAAGESKNMDLYLYDTVEKKPVADMAIKVNTFDPNLGTFNLYEATTDNSGHVRFIYTAPANLPTNNLSIGFEIVNGTNPQTETVTVSFGTGSSDYDLINVNNITVNYASENKEIAVQLVKNGIPQVGENVTSKSIPTAFGHIENVTVLTGADGYARFNYIAADPLTAGTVHLDLVYKDTNGAEATATATIMVSPSMHPRDYNLTYVTTPLIITQSDQREEINAYVVDAQTGVGTSGKIVNISAIDGIYGAITPASATTDAAGKATFIYTSPHDLNGTALNTTTVISFTDADGIPQTKDVEIQIIPLASSSDYELMNQSDINGTIGVNKTMQTEIQLVKNGLPVIDARPCNTTNTVTVNCVIPAAIPREYGRIVDAAGSTTKSGYVEFEYKAPNTPIVITDYKFPVYYIDAEGNIAAEANITIDLNVTDINTTVPPVDDSSYTLEVLPVELNISVPGGTPKTITVRLTDNNGVAVANQSIIAYDLNLSEGTLDKYRGETDNSGFVQFNYTAPLRLPAASANIVFEVENGLTPQEANVTVNFDSATYTITPEVNTTISNTSTAYVLHVALSKTMGTDPAEPAVGKTVVAEFVMPMYGTIANYEAIVDSSGIATFDYTSPSDISDINDTNVTFYYKENHTVTGKTLLIFDPQTVVSVDAMYVVPDSFTITQSDEEHTITIVTVNSENVGISTNVQLEQPNNGTDYGSFDTNNVTTDANGVAHVIYTAPASINGLSERNITVTELSTNIAQELNIKFGTADTNGTNYEIYGEVPDSLSVDSTEQISIKIREIGNTGHVIDDADVHEVNLTSRFTNMLTFSNGSATATYTGLGVNSVQVETQTLSGVAIVEVNASVFNGDHDVVLSALIPVTVLSGPVTAMSIFYVGSSETDAGEFVNTYTVHAVDRYANPARAGVMIHPSLINGTKINPWHTVYNNKGKINENSPSKDQFRDTTEDFNDAEITTHDRLIVVPNASRYDNSYLGNWSISDIVNNHTVELDEEYYGADEENLSYVIGNENRNIIDEENNISYGIAVADIQSKAGGYKTDVNGNVQFNVVFDPILAGHTVTIAASTYDINRTGVAKIADLKWEHYNSTNVLVNNDGDEHNVTLTLGISNSNDDPLEYLVNVYIPVNSIESTSAKCWVKENGLPIGRSNIVGQITFVVDTNGSGVGQCGMTWSKTSAGIYREY